MGTIIRRMTVYQGNVVSVLEFPIKHLFESTSKDIEFIHGSIYEYFVSEYIFNSITAALNQNGTKEMNLAGVLGSLLKENHLSEEILEFLKYKIANSELAEEYDVVNETFELMMKDGMTYYTNMCYQNSLDCEMNVFVNMLELLHSWEKKYYLFDKSIFFYMNGNPDIRYNLRKAIINDDIWGLFFRSADLRYADLRGAYLAYAKLENVDFRNAYLTDAVIDEKQLKYFKKCKVKGSRVYIKGKGFHLL